MKEEEEEEEEQRQRLLEVFKPGSEAESDWLKNIFSFVFKHQSVLTCSPAPSSEERPITGVYHLSVCAVRSIQENLSVAHTLPVSYRLLSVSELVSQQHLSCVSNLSWSTNQQRAWAREAELAAPGQKALPRVNLLLIGCLTEGRGGAWRLKDSSGSVQCECLSPSPQWLNRPVFLPYWHYVPHNASGQAEGCLELIGPPVFLDPSPPLGLAGSCAGGAGPVGVREAVALLRDRVKGQRLSVCGEVGWLGPLLDLTGTTFFCFTLTDQTLSLRVIAQDCKLCWWPCLRVGLRVCVTALRVCVLRGWRGNRVLCVTQHSELHANYAHAQPDTPPLLMTSQTACVDDNSKEAEPKGAAVQSGVRLKRSRVISYQGTVTAVVNEGAGLYVLDGSVGLCVAYQPRRRRSLRGGDRLELHHVHFLYRPCPDLPPSMLCTCLRSSLRVTSFSAVGGACATRSDEVLPRLLLRSHRGVSDYLWACHMTSTLRDSLVPAVLQQKSVCLLSWRLMETLSEQGGGGRGGGGRQGGGGGGGGRGRGRQGGGGGGGGRQGGGGGGHRDIYSEMLDEDHSCLLSQYSADPSVPQCVSVSEVCASLLSSCWSSPSLSSLLSSDGPSLSCSQLNSALSWSSRTLSSDPRTGTSLRGRPLLLVGVLQLPSGHSQFQQCVQLTDGTGSISCVLTETPQDRGGQGRGLNTAWIGCLVCVHQFSMVMERFLQSEFPSYQHLDQDKFITHKHCRVYLQFSLDHVVILSPGVAMETYLRQKGVESDDILMTAEGETEERRRSIEDEVPPTASSVAVTSSSSVGGAPRPCVSVLISLENKEGVAWRNTGAGSQTEARLSLYFVVKASVIGPVVSWGRDPKNGPTTDRETRKEGAGQVILAFSGGAARWYPVLHTGTLYRLVAVNTQDPSALIGSEGQRHTDPTLQVQPDWRFHTLTRPLLHPQSVSRMMSVSEVLDSSQELVCLQGVLTERIPLCDRTTGVRLSVCGPTGSSLQVYLKSSPAPFPPGLLPGNTVQLFSLQRRTSRSGSVYCSYLPISDITVTSLGDGSSAQAPPPPTMHLGPWALTPGGRCPLARVRGHMVCFLSLQLQWVCSLCSSMYTQSCSRSVCGSSSSVFHANAKVVVEDGTGEAHVWFSGAVVRSLLGLADSQWEGLQRAIRVKGYIRIYPRGRSLVSNGDCDDLLHHFLLSVCSSDLSRPLLITCRKQTNQRAQEVRRFSRLDRDFVTRLIGPLQLTCLQLHTDSAPC